MEGFFTLLVRLVAVAFVATCVWFVLGSAGDMFARVQSDRMPDADLELVDQSDSGNLRLENGNWIALAAGLFVFVGILGVVEGIGFSRFKNVKQTIESCGGTIRFTPHSESDWICYFFGTPTVDLSRADLGGEFPALRSIPRIVSLRVCGIPMTEHMANEICRCRSLSSLDLTDTGASQKHVEQMAKMPRLKNFLRDPPEQSKT